MRKSCWTVGCSSSLPTATATATAANSRDYSVVDVVPRGVVVGCVIKIETVIVINIDIVGMIVTTWVM